jgi:transketolase
LGRSEVGFVSKEQDDFQIGKADIVTDGEDVTIIACGMMVFNAQKASKILDKKGLSARVVNMHTLKPIDQKAISDSAKKTGAIVTCEEHSVIGGLGSTVSRVVTTVGPIVPIEMVGTQDVFGESGEAEELVRHFHLAPEDIAAAAEKAIKRKK